MMNTTSIYELSENGTPYYVGKTTNHLKRKSRHLFDSIKSSVLTIIDSVNSVDKKDWEPVESYWIEQYKQWGFNLKNKNNGGGGPQSLTKEQVAKKVANTDYKAIIAKRKIDYNKIRKPIYQYDLQGNFIQEWPSATNAAKVLWNEKPNRIGECLNGRQKTAKGFIWKFKN